MMGFGRYLFIRLGLHEALGAEFGWGREAISRGFGLAALTLAIASPLLASGWNAMGRAGSSFLA